VLLEDTAGAVWEEFEVGHAGDVAAGGDDVVGALVEVGKAPVAIHEGDAVGGAFEDGGESLGGFSLGLAGGVGDGDFLGEVVGEAGVFHGGASLSGDGDDLLLPVGGEDVWVRVAEEHAAEVVAVRRADGDGEVTADGEMAEWGPAEGAVAAEAGIVGDVGGAEDGVVENGRAEEIGYRGERDAGHDRGVFGGKLVALDRATVRAGGVIEEDTEAGTGELPAGFKRCLDNGFEAAFTGQGETGFDEQIEASFMRILFLR